MPEQLEEITKVCPVCGCTDLLLLGTLNQKRCGNKNCRAIIPWYLEAGQEQLIKYTR